MKKIIIFFISLYFIVSIYAGDQSYVLGVEGLKAGSLPSPGNYLKTYFATYQADTLNNISGEELFFNPELRVYASVIRFLKVYDFNILGANYAYDIIIPIQQIDFDIKKFNIDESSFGIGDICIEPFILSWHGSNFDAAFGIGWYLPTGKYDSKDISSIGKDYYTTMLTSGITYYFDNEKTLHFAILPRYEIHDMRDDDGYKKGDDFHVEFGLGKTVNGIDFGLVGYWQKEITKGDDKLLTPLGTGGGKDSVWAVGLEVMTFFPAIKSFVSLRTLKEYDAEDKFEGWFTCFTVVTPL